MWHGQVLNYIENYSVQTYCNNIHSSVDDSTRTLIADMLEYGTAAQKYVGGFGESSYANSLSWVEDAKSSVNTAPDATDSKQLVTSTDTACKVDEAGTSLGNSVYLYFDVLSDEPENTDVYIYRDRNDGYGNRFVKKVSLANESGTDNVFRIKSDAIKATGYDDVYTVEVVKNNKTVHKVTYSVRSYVKAKHEDSSLLGALVNALYNYGISAKKYRG